MRFPRLLMALGTTLLLGAQSALAQQLTIEVKTTEARTVWYTEPVWLGLGAVVLLIIIVLAVMASRNKSTTTVIR